MKTNYKTKLVAVLSLFCFLVIQSQSYSQNDKFPFGVYAPEHWYENYAQIKDMGANTIIQYAKRPEGSNPGNLESLLQFQSSIALNYEQNDYIHHYSGGYYKKWEAEENILDEKSGVKHSFGEVKYVGNKLCWSTGNQATAQDNFVFGPDYAQDKKYRQSYMFVNYELTYVVKFNLCLETQPLQPVDVCRIRLVFKYYDEVTKTIETYNFPDPRVVNSSELSTNQFTDITMTYTYPEQFVPQNSKELRYIDGPTSNTLNYDDRREGTGIQFVVDYLGVAKICVDYIEVYDQQIWGGYISDSVLVKSRIIVYATNSGFNPLTNLSYWHSQDAPLSLDGYEPYRVIDAILDSVPQAKPIITDFYPMWNGLINGRNSFERWNTLAKPKQLMFWYYPTWFSDSPVPHSNMDYLLGLLRARFQEAYTIKPNFYYLAPTMNFKFDSGSWYYRKPEGTELRAMLMLALAHGSKGIFFMHYYSYWSDSQQSYLRCEGLVNVPESLYSPTPLWSFVKENISPRINGVLGNTLLKLNYTGDFLQYKYITPTQNPLPAPPNYDYLTIGLQATNHDMNWHVGFLKEKDVAKLNNNYFLMTNLWTNSPKSIQVKVTPPTDAQGYSNYSFRNIEPENNFDITFNTQTIQTLNFPAGEGYLFQVAPVALYGGKLVYNENVGEGMTLYDDISIENGATLYIYDTYNAKANITVKAGGKIISAENAKIIFDPGKKLIVEGSAEIKGTSTNRLALEFNSSTNQGVVIKAGAIIDMQYCDIKYSQVGIAAEVGTEGIYISSSSFINCTATGILMLGDTQHNEATPIVSNCTFTNCSTGISAANYSEILINQNTVNNAYLGITISSIPSAFIQGNVIIGNSNSNNDGILISNSGGYIRSNIIQNHINGIRLGNSSPDIGGNILENNIIHGLYVGSGSIPNLVGHLQINPPLYFPLSGYNKIFNNGSGTLANTPGNDSQSEIFLSASNITLRDGCNEIRDDRTATPSMNTLLLMNGSLATGGGRQLDARNNYWGTTTPTAARFGSLSVIFSPYYGEPCLLPDGGGGSGEEILVLKTSSGEIVDSISAAEGVPENFTTLEASYSEADNYFATGNVELAKPIYEQIVSSNCTTEEKLPAYNKLYTIGNLIGEDENYFNSLQTTFNDIASAETDTLLKKIYNQNAIKCDVSKEEYLTAISKFDNIIQQNPNSEEAVYAEIDIITTALNLDTTNSQLGKMGNGKYLVKGTSDYLSKLNDILQSKFGIDSEEKEQIIPKEYSLYQNYPNPFNPVTTIKFDLPNDGLITLEIFDILGRRISTLVEEYKTAGSYEQVFNASSLASGVYVYKLQAGDFISSKKMILLK